MDVQHFFLSTLDTTVTVTHSWLESCCNLAELWQDIPNLGLRGAGR